ncbi:hypothetical protein IB238_23850 [Rhizobium sp. ARZ01]|uniref:hypothetical protein n=1 Tax=Rhizobium sp. ARZ01 TaxID=2769313 RepID=UPI001785E0A0|nr:hypothetical protein [Rhizobium sp. ARZ01]MBD9375645.1 hypothetical protein [Rhizobium sp. ARZ01]
MDTPLPLWPRLIITVITMLVASYVIGLGWQGVFGGSIPSYVAGVIGGLAALPIWDLLKRIGPSAK